MDIGLLVYPRLTALDLIAPWEVLRRLPDSRTHMIWTRAGPVLADGGLEITTTVAFEDTPHVDLILVPGGPGQESLMKHTILLDFLRARAGEAAWICAVSTGALLLAQAGLLKGKRATTQEVAREALAAFDVEVVAAPWVIDGKLATSSGGAASSSLALELTRRIAGDERASAVAEELELHAIPTPD